MITKHPVGAHEAHRPASHDWPEGHWPHDPPHPSSPQALPQHLGEHETHVDISQLSPSGHWPHDPPHPSSPQAPSRQRGVHRPHVPATHISPAGQIVPQLPQLASSEESSTHLPPQQLALLHDDAHEGDALPVSGLPAESKLAILASPIPSEASSPLAASYVADAEPGRTPPVSDRTLPPQPIRTAAKAVSGVAAYFQPISGMIRHPFIG
jgi:hypothetical protein